MKYMGSKAKIAKQILPIILKGDYENYIEPFAGGMNSICEVPDCLRKTAYDTNLYLIAMFKELQNGWKPPEYIDRDTYSTIRQNNNNFDPHLVGWVAFNCSYSGKYFGGFAGEVTTKTGTRRNYQSEAIRNITKQMDKLKSVEFKVSSYANIATPRNSVIYCDPPYAGTTTYFEQFDTDAFWEWVRINSKNNTIFVSEYSAPDDFDVVWEGVVKSSLSANSKGGSSKSSVEKLFKYKG